ncbi:MAG: hypothetical protein V4697_01920 [Patescibacteria group bacterium]
MIIGSGTDLKYLQAALLQHKDLADVVIVSDKDMISLQESQLRDMKQMEIVPLEQLKILTPIHLPLRPGKVLPFIETPKKLQVKKIVATRARPAHDRRGR